MTENDVIDPAALDALMETTGGDPDFLGELIDVFLTDAVELLAAMDGALAGGDAGALRRAAHSLKSNAATFGATRLTALARQLEDEPRVDRPERGVRRHVTLADQPLDLGREAGVER